MKRLWSVLLGVLMLGSTLAAPAAIISVNDVTFGADSLTRDTDTDLDWLDLRFTRGISFSEITPRLASGEQFDGYQIATVDQVETFFIHAGVTLGSVNFVGPGDAPFDAVARLLDLIDALSDGFDSQASFALTSSIAGGAGLRVRSLLEIVYPPSICCSSQAAAFPLWSTVGDQFSANIQGAWLIRPTPAAQIDSPDTLALMYPLLILALLRRVSLPSYPKASAISFPP